jgi:hypothetical protein
LLESAVKRVPHRQEGFTDIAQFSKIAPFLPNPFVLVGFVVFLVSLIYWTLIKAQILVPVSQTQSTKIVHKFLNHGFAIAFAIVLLGFAYAFYDLHNSINAQRARKIFAPQGDKDQNIDTNNGTAVQENK